MSQENKALVRRLFELMERDGPVPEELLGPGFTYHVAGSPPLDVKATQQRVGVIGAAFSNIKHVLEDVVAEGDRVAFRTRFEMTHTGEFMGVAASNKQVSVVEMGFMRITNGKIAEMWGLLDSLTLMRQIGAMPSPGQPKPA